MGITNFPCRRALQEFDGSGTIDVADVSGLATTWGACSGDSAFLPCADFVPDGCVNISDVVTFNDIYYSSGAKLVQEIGNAAVEIEDLGSGCVSCRVVADGDWDYLVAQIVFSADGRPSLTWLPRAEFLNRSVLAESSTGGIVTQTLYVFGGGDGGEVYVGDFCWDADQKNATMVRGVAYVGASEVIDSESVPFEAPDVELRGVAPNPFNPCTTISFSLSRESTVSLFVYDVVGRQVVRLLDGAALAPGVHRVEWDGSDSAGRRVAGGTYLCRLFSGDVDLVRRMTLLK